LNNEDIYTKKGNYVLRNINLDFVYEVCVFYHGKNYFALIDIAFYKSRIEISKVLNSFFIDSYTEIRADLYSAPLSWLIDNHYVKYIKPDKIVKNKTKSNQSDKPKVTTRKSSRR